MIKDHHFYNKTDSLWNEFSRLSPQLKQYSHENVDPKKTFKKTVRDLPKVIEQEKNDEFLKKYNLIT